jgi:hypothetical protein
VIRDPLDETECVRCGMLRSDCCCTLREPTREEAELGRHARMTRSELCSLTASEGANPNRVRTAGAG